MKRIFSNFIVAVLCLSIALPIGAMPAPPPGRERDKEKTERRGNKRDDRRRGDKKAPKPWKDDRRGGRKAHKPWKQVSRGKAPKPWRHDNGNHYGHYKRHWRPAPPPPRRGHWHHPRYRTEWVSTPIVGAILGLTFDSRNGLQPVMNIVASPTLTCYSPYRPVYYKNYYNPYCDWDYAYERDYYTPDYRPMLTRYVTVGTPVEYIAPYWYGNPSGVNFNYNLNSSDMGTFHNASLSVGL